MDPHQALASLLLSFFSADELRRFLRYLPDGDALVSGLPGPTASPATLVHESVGLLVRSRQVVDATFWDRLTAERPRRADEVKHVRGLFAAQAEVAAASPRPNKAALPNTITILFASASPERDERLRVDIEQRKIMEKVRGARYRDRLNPVQITAVRFEDLRTALMQHEPHVLHISCHGTTQGELKFEPRDDGSNIVPAKNLVRLLRALGRNLRLVVLNACNSAKLASEIAAAVGPTVGMERVIEDRVATEFSVAFYETLAFGREIDTAFEVALSSLSGADDELPQLFPPEDQDPEQRRRQKLVGESL